MTIIVLNRSRSVTSSRIIPDINLSLSRERERENPKRFSMEKLEVSGFGGFKADKKNSHGRSRNHEMVPRAIVGGSIGRVESPQNYSRISSEARARLPTEIEA